MADLKLALRSLLKSPFVTAVAIVSLALGIGANAAIYSLFDQMLMRPLPVEAPERLVNLGAPGPKPGSQSCNQAGDCDQVFSYLMFRDLEKDDAVLSGVAAHVAFGANLAYKGQTSNGGGMLVSGSYFPVLGVQPAVGRLLQQSDDTTVGGHFVTVLSHDYWRTRFDANPGVVGETLTINGQPMTIVGVAPEGFDGTTLGSDPQVYVPITMRGLMIPGWNQFENRRAYWAYLFGRLKPGVSIDQARTALNVTYKAIVNDVEAPLQQGMSDQTLERFRAREITVEPGQPRPEQHAPRGARAAAPAARGHRRGGAHRVRQHREPAAGARRVALDRDGGAAVDRRGPVAARAAAARRVVPARPLRRRRRRRRVALDAGPDGVDDAGRRHAVHAVRAASLGAAVHLRAGARDGRRVRPVPGAAQHASRPRVGVQGRIRPALGREDGQAVPQRLATAQMALSMALLVSAGLFARSLLNVSRVDLGLKPDHLIVFGVSPWLNNYKPDQTRALFERIEDEIGALPGVTGVTASMVPVISGSNWGTDVRVEGFESGPDIDSNSRYNEVGADYFRTMGMTILSGRDFERSDALGRPKVAIVNETFAKKFNLGREAVGKRMRLSGSDTQELDIEIVGLAQNAKYAEVKQEIPPLFVIPYRQDDDLGFINFYVRTSVDPEALLGTIPTVVARLDPNLPVEELKTMEMQVRDNVFVDRMITTMSTAFAALATLLAAIGLYGVLAYTVAQRTREFGLRMALGADGPRLRRMVLTQVAWMALIGGVIGLGAAMGIGRLAQSLLYQMESTDPLVLAGAAVLLTAIALVSGFIPALRASRIDPMTALRYE